MTTTQMTLLAIKAHAFDEIDELIGELWEYGDDKRVVTHTLLRSTGLYTWRKR